MRSEIKIAALGMLLASGCAHSQLLVSDGFGDGDRDNDGILDGPVSDAGDIGQAWYLARGTDNVTVSVADDASGIGSGSAIDVISDSSAGRMFVSTFAPVTLEDGDRIIMRLDVRITENPIDPVDTLGGGDADRRFRFGLYDGKGTDVSGDTGDGTITDDDTGYNVQADCGIADGGTSITGRGDPAPILLGGGTVSMSASTAGDDFAATNDSKQYEYVITRSGNDMTFSIVVDGVLADDGQILEADLAANGLGYVFDTVAFGSNGAAVDFRVDNVEVELVEAPDSSATMDGFEDGDRDNDGVADGPVNDLQDLGFNWYYARGSSGTLVDIVDDTAGIGSGNAFRSLVSTTSVRAMIATIDEVSLGDGDTIAFQFDMRIDGFAPDSDRRFRWGVYHSAGTPVSADSNSSALTDDDPGYMVQMDTGASVDSSVTIRRDLIGSLLSGGTMGIGATSDDPVYSLGTAPRTLRLELERNGSEMLARVFVDGVLATEGVDPEPDTFVFDEIAFSTNSIPLISYLVDNVVVEVPNAAECLADVNGDGAVTPTDFTAWINAFNNNLPECDQNGDGSCSPTDFTAWIANFNVGCP